MANRAYLYFTDDVSALTFEDHYQKRDGSERNYFDSRHQFPLAWFLFFEPESVLLQERPDDWPDLYLVREWSRAKADFERRAALLLSWFSGEFSHDDMQTFLVWAESLREAPDEVFLVVDPRELEIEETSAPAMRAALAAMENPALSSADKFQQLDAWSFTRQQDKPERRYEKVFGNYYGPSDEGAG